MISPRHATRRRPERPTTGAQTAVIARSLGLDPMPAQRYVADVAGELLPDGTPAYTTVILSMPRRAGKTALALSVLLRAAMAARRRRLWYTAQSRQDAAVVVRDDWLPILASSPLDPYVPVRLANGSEGISVPRLTSTCRVFAPTPRALHGSSGDLVMFDECWSHPRALGAQLEIAARPLMATRPDGQLWLLSAAGDIDSTWWIDQLDAGRAAAAADTGTGTAFFEWSADADGVDLDDPAVWFDTHPAARTADNPTGTITRDWFHAEHDRAPAQFYRVYLNVTDRTGATSAPIDADRWRSLAVDVFDRAGRDLVAGVACSPDQASTSIVVAGVVDGVAVVELVDHRPGHDWAPGRLVDLVDRWRLGAVALDPGGPSSPLLRPCRIAGVPIVELPLRDCTAAAADLVAAVRSGTVRNVPAPALDDAAEHARRRTIGDGSWLFGRSNAADVDVSPIEAAAFARFVLPDLYAAGAGVA